MIDDQSSTLLTFLHAHGLDKYTLGFNREQMDMRSTLLCTLEDFRSIGIPLGPSKRITEAIERRYKLIKDAKDIDMVDDYV